MINKKDIISLISRIYLNFRLQKFTLGARSMVYGWRIKGHRNTKLMIGDNSITTFNLHFEKPHATLVVGKRTFIGKAMMSIAKKVEIGDDVMISWGVTITDHNSHSLKFTDRALDIQAWARGCKDWSKVKTAEVKICDKSWVGFNSIILKGVTIGEGAIVGAGAVVTKDVPPWTIVAGNPAKIIRELGSDER